MSRSFRALFLSHSERGQALVLFAAGLVAFLGLVGMSVDVGRVMYTRTDLQKIADAAALAGAQDLPASSTSAATDSATTFGSYNGSASLLVTFSDTFAVNDTITVKATRHVPYNFLKFVGLSGAPVSAEATAKGAIPKTITGYNLNKVAPFIIWGGSRQSEVNAGDAACALHVCVGSSYTFMSAVWMNKQGKPTAPDWTASDSMNFKGDVNHGAGAPVSQIGETFSVGGLGSVTVPTPGSILVIPIVNKASDGSNLRNFRIAAWVVIRVDAGCNKNGCKGTVLNPLTLGFKPPAGWDTSGSTPPPPSLDYKGTASTILLE